MNSKDSKDGAERRERAVAEGAGLRESAVAHARKVGDDLGLKEAPTSPDAPPAYPAPAVAAPPVAAPPYPRRVLKETMPATPRAIARHIAESRAPVEAQVPEVLPTAISPAAIPPTVVAAPAPADPDPAR